MACPFQLHLPVSIAAATMGGGGRVRSTAFATASGQRTRVESCVRRAYDSAGTSSTATASSVDALPSAGAAGTIRVNITPPRPTSTPPTPPSLIHSPVYVQKALIKPSVGEAAVTPSSSRAARSAQQQEEEQQDGADGNSLLWALKQVDRSLDELEANPLPLQKEIYEFSRSPVGTATSSAFTAAAKVTVAATREAVKAALPVGQWVVKEGAKAAFSLVSKAMAESARQQQQGGGGSGTTKIVVKKAKK